MTISDGSTRVRWTPMASGRSATYGDTFQLLSRQASFIVIRSSSATRQLRACPRTAQAVRSSVIRCARLSPARIMLAVVC